MKNFKKLDPLLLASYLEKIQQSPVYDVAHKTPLIFAPKLSSRLGCSVFLKREDMQPIFSFKIRGAYQKMASLSQEELLKGVITASAGNHAQGVAFAAQKLGCFSTIVMPVTTPSVKIEGVQKFGSDVVLSGDSYSDAFETALVIKSEKSLVFVHPFNDPDVIAGQGTVGMEILSQHEGPLDAIFIPIGGGGLAAGIAVYIKQIRPEVRLIGVQISDSDAMNCSIQYGAIVKRQHVGLFSDGTAVKEVGSETFLLCKHLLDEILLVTQDQVCSAIKDVFEETRCILEPAGALAVAGVKAYSCTRAAALPSGSVVGGSFVAITSGANMNFERLRVIAERVLLGEDRERLFLVQIPEERGSFRRFCLTTKPHNVTEFCYRMRNPLIASVLVGIQINRYEESATILDALQKEGFHVQDLSDDVLAQTHLKHFSGGASQFACQERLYRFEFPERSGSLMEFLLQMNPEWNISLFHYKNNGTEFGQVLVGLQVPDQDECFLQDFLSALKFPCVEETTNPGYQALLCFNTSKTS